MTKHVFITTQFEGYHCWPEAPEIVAFLRTLHRHIFKVEVAVVVKESNREVEFFLLKQAVNRAIHGSLQPSLLAKKTLSCEMMAEHLIEALKNAYQIFSVEVNEDGENGSVVYV